MNKKIENLEKSIQRIQSKEFNVVFSVPDTKGGPKGDVAQCYFLAKMLKDANYQVTMLYENNDYTRVGSWLGEEYDELPHTTMAANELLVTPADILIIPEAYGHLVEQTQALPINRVVFVQDYENMLNAYMPGKSWLDYNITETLVLSEKIGELVKQIIHSPNVQVISPIVDDNDFFNKNGIRTPQIAIHTKNPAKTLKIIKEFHLKYPLLKWVPIRDIHNVPYYELNNELNKSCVSVWVNHETSFGTFPIESIKTNTPVIALVPYNLPDWFDLTGDSMIFTYDETEIVDFMARYMKGWLEDSLPTEFSNVDACVKGKYNKQDTKSQIIDVIKNISDRRLTILENLLQIEINNEITERKENSL